MSIENPNITNIGAGDNIPLNPDALMVVPEDFSLLVSQGKVDGYKDIEIIGYNADIDVGTETIWPIGGIYVPMTSAQTLSIVSTNANDDIVGTGARQIMIEGVDASRNLQVEIVDMNGVVAVVTGLRWLGVNKVTVVTAGTTGYNLGNITLTASISLSVQGYMIAEESISNMVIYHQPMGSNLYMDSLVIQVDKITGGTQPTIYIRGYIVTQYGVRIQIYIDVMNPDYTPLIDTQYRSKVVIPEGSYMYYEAKTDVNNTFVRVRISGTRVNL